MSDRWGENPKEANEIDSYNFGFARNFLLLPMIYFREYAGMASG